MHSGAYQLQPPGGPADGDGGTQAHADGFQLDGEDLPFKVQVWDSSGMAVQEVVAVSMTAAIGYAAYYAATREYPGRAITLRHNGRIISRWSQSSH